MAIIRGVMNVVDAKFDVLAHFGNSGAAVSSLSKAARIDDSTFDEMMAYAMKPGALEFILPSQWRRGRRGAFSNRRFISAIHAHVPHTLGELDTLWGCVVSPNKLDRGVHIRSDRAPHMPTALCAMASASIPTVFEPVDLPGLGWCGDGGTKANVPSNMFDDLEADVTVIARMHNPERDVICYKEAAAAMRVNRRRRIGSKILATGFDLFNLPDGPQTVHDSIVIDLDPPESLGSSMDFSLTLDEVRARREWGEEFAAKFLA